MEKRKIRVSVRNLVEFILRSGDIDNRHGKPADVDAMLEGGRLHRKLQGKMKGDYKSEVPLSREHEQEEYVLSVEGRADGIFTGKMSLARKVSPCEEDSFGKDETEEKNQEITWVDEIKGMYRDLSALDYPIPVHLAQAKCYAAIYAHQNQKEQIGIQMTCANLDSEEIRYYRQIYKARELWSWYMEVVERYLKWIDFQIRWQRESRESIRKLTFPYPWRPGQKDVSAAVYRTILRKKKLFLQASTGTGKTLATLFPALKAVGEGHAENIFYGTAKTVTRTVAEEGYKILRDHGLRFRTATLTAKEKICFMEECECNPEKCPYAKGHFDRVNDAVYELITSSEVIDRTAIEEQAGKWQVCPFEMGLDAAEWCDGVICDYNYIFDPRAKLKRFFGEGVKGKYIFLIDEAHNLVERGREMYSAVLYKEDFLKLKKEVTPYSKRIAKALGRCNSWMLEKKRECESVRELEDVGTFPLTLMNLTSAIDAFLEDNKNPEIGQKILELYFPVRTFLDVCDRLNENYLIYSQIDDEGRFLIRLFCVDISENLQECLDQGISTVFFSATFLPIQYYRSLLSTKTNDYSIYARSVFDPSRRLVLSGNDVSSRYKERGPRKYQRIASYILQTIRARRGNYMVFFSSYKMLEEAADSFELLCRAQGEKIDILIQKSGMHEKDRETFLQEFEEAHPQGLAGFCVMGGIFGEGIDLRHDRLIGAIIVGTGLPQICPERDFVRLFYERRGEDGFFYAYLCPGMNKVLQSAGRVIRTEEDAGVVALLDDRFSRMEYKSMFPAEWEKIDYCTESNISSKLKEFWSHM